jgi:hypothetical protein
VRIAESAAITIPLGSWPVPRALWRIEKTTVIFTKLVAEGGFKASRDRAATASASGNAHARRRELDRARL